MQPLILPLQPTQERPWRPMTDEEWRWIAFFLDHQHGRPRLGRPPRNLRVVWDGIFWIACSTRPWIDMPAEFGRPDTAHSALIYAARKHWLDGMLLAVSRHPFARPEMAEMEWPVCRAFRRASRQLPLSSLMLARDLGLASALYCDPALIPPSTGHLSLDPPDAVARLPRLPRRVLRGLPPHWQTPMALAPLPQRKGTPIERRASQTVARPVRRLVKR